MLFMLRASLVSLTPDVATHGDGCSDKGAGTENENGVQNSHRGEDNKRKRGGRGSGRLGRYGCGQQCERQQRSQEVTEEGKRQEQS